MNCPFWHPPKGPDHDLNLDLGLCYRFPPIITGKDQEGYQQEAYPETLYDDWCGEHPDILQGKVRGQ